MMNNEKIRGWYLETFPEDSLGHEINPEVTFTDLFEALDAYRDVYRVIGVCDSVVRSRCFVKLADLMGVDYGYVYDQWLRADYSSARV